MNQLAGILVLCYIVGLLLGSLAFIEWLVQRIVRMGLAGLVAGFVVLLGSVVARFRRRMV